jgi:hypothetical protein
VVSLGRNVTVSWAKFRTAMRIDRVIVVSAVRALSVSRAR